MARTVVMPRQGNSVESCVVVSWKVREGQELASGDLLCEVETDKAVFEVRAESAGTVLKLLADAGDEVPVLAPIAVLGEPGETWEGSPEPPVAPGLVSDTRPAEPVRKAPAGDDRGSAPSLEAVRAAPGISPRARARARSEGLDPSRLAGTGPGGRILERDVKSAAGGRERLTAAALAAVQAGEFRRPSAEDPGGAIGGRIGLDELRAAAEAAGQTVRGGDSADPEPDRLPIRGIRRLIAERMMQSVTSTAQVTFHASADAERLVSIRERFKSGRAGPEFTAVTVGDLLLFAASRVLPRFPEVNATLERGVLQKYKDVHLGIAVDTLRGLLVPVLRDAQAASLLEISSRAAALSEACRNGSVDPETLGGGTFTVTNLGALGIESFTPILNYPQVAILGVDAISLRPVQDPDGGVSFARRIGLSLTVDHQVLDGAPAARFLQALARAVADIDLLTLSDGAGR